MPESDNSADLGVAFAVHTIAMHSEGLFDIGVACHVSALVLRLNKHLLLDFELHKQR